MRFNVYQQLAARTSPTNPNEETIVDSDNIKNFCMGLSGECGEVVDYLKKVLYHNHPLDKAEIKKELGDILWYVSSIAYEYNISLGEIAEMNIEKLKNRYPEGFSTERSVNRVD